MQRRLVLIALISLMLIMALAACSQTPVPIPTTRAPTSGSSRTTQTAPLPTTGTPTSGSSGTTGSTSPSATPAPTAVPSLSETLARIRQTLGMSPAEVEQLLGSEHAVTQGGAEGTTQAWRYDKPGFTIAFNTRNPQGRELAFQVAVDSPGIDLYGTRLGMSFSDIMRLRGQTTIRSSFVKDDNSPSHYIAYSRDGLNIVYDTGSPPDQPPVARNITITRAA